MRSVVNPAFLPALLRAAVIGLACGVPLLILTGCQDVAVRPRALKPLTISAASDLTYAFRELGQQFTAETGQPVVFNFGSTGQLSQQIEQGAPVDLFAAADVSFIDDLGRQGLVIVDTRQVYARGRIVLWQRADSALKLTQIGDLARTDVARIAIANPDHAPYGIAARQALQNAGIWSAVQPKLVLGENVRQALQYAETGNVDVAIVALSLTTPGASDVGSRTFLIPEALHAPLDQGLAVVTGTRHEAAARAFAAYVTNPRGRAILHRYGFVLPGEEPSR